VFQVVWTVTVTVGRRLSELRASLQSQPLPRTEKPPAPTVSRRPTSRDVAAGQPTLHAEVAEILRDSTATWMPTAAIADLVNARRRYSKKDGSPVTPFQIHGRTRQYPTSSNEKAHEPRSPSSRTSRDA
jgi:hypothetical protein